MSRHPSPSGVVRACYELASPEEFSQAVSGATLRAEFLARGAAAARIERYIGADWAIDFFESGIKARLSGPLLPRWVALCLVLGDAGSRWYGHGSRAGTLLCNPPDIPIEGCMVPGFRGMSVTVPVSVWEECRRLAGRAEGTLNGFRVIPLPAPVFQSLLPAVNNTHECLRQRSSLCATCETPASSGRRLARHLVTLAWEHSGARGEISTSSVNRFRLAREVEGWMRDHLAERFDIADVSLRFRVSRRELEYAFRSTFAESPRAYLHSLRLNAAHAALIKSTEGTSVTEIALSHGLTHLGRFPAQYRSLFGHRPADLLKQDRGSGKGRAARASVSDPGPRAASMPTAGPR
jgi:AraC-like DNA-binding protein